MFNVNPKQMEQMMKKLGMQTQQIGARRVVIEAEDKQIIIDSPQVTKIKMAGQETFQIMGEVHEEAKQQSNQFSKDDIDLIIQQTGASEAAAIQALQETQDLAQAIMKLKK